MRPAAVEALLPWLGTWTATPPAHQLARAARRGGGRPRGAGRRCSDASWARSCSPRAAPRPTTSLCGVPGAGVAWHGARTPRRPRIRWNPWGGSSRSTPAASSTSTRWRARARRRTSPSCRSCSPTTRSERQRLDACRRAVIAGRPPRCCTPTRCRPRLARRRRPGAARGPGQRSAATSSAGPKGVGALVVRGGVASADAPRWRPGARSPQRHAERRRHSHGGGGCSRRPGRGRPCRSAARPPDRRAARRRPGYAVETGERRQGRGDLPPLHPGVESEALLFLLDRAGVCASAASSCAVARQSRRTCSPRWACRRGSGGSLRLSLGWTDHRRRRRRRPRGRARASWPGRRAREGDRRHERRVSIVRGRRSAGRRQATRSSA